MRVLRDTNGFSLIEILIATVIITIASLGVATLTVGIIQGNSFSKRLTIATSLAQDRLEQVKRLGYANADTAAASENYGTIANYDGYKRVTSVANNTPALNMKLISVNVYWNSDKHSVNVSTILSE